MTEQEIELYIYRIILGKFDFVYKKKKYFFRSPTIVEKKNALNIYYRIISSEKYEDWLRDSGVDGLLIYTNCWNPETPRIIKQLDKELEKAKIALYLNRMHMGMRAKSKESIDKIRKRQDRIMQYKYSLQSNTIEYYANTIKNEYLMCKCLTHKGKPVFTFNYKSRPSYYQDLANQCFESKPSIEQLKKIARSSIWRPYWTTGKASVFGKSAVDLSDEQRSLINFSSMYDSVMEHPESPEEFVLEDDDMLDGWFYHQRDKAKKEKMQSDVSSRHPHANEVFMMANNQQDYDLINSMNDMEAQSIIKSRLNAVKKAGKVDDLDLPDIKHSINQDMMSRR